jgi:glycosyltransferase involved in cell wall biosynthesis
VRRIERYLGKLGCVVKVFSLDIQYPESLATALRNFSPDIIHAFHAIRCGAVASEISRELNLPYIITITGTDLYGDNSDTVLTGEERNRIENASALVAFHEIIGKRAATAFPVLTNRIKTIPQGVEVPEIALPVPLPESPFVFLLPAGIRPVKNILYSFRPLERLWRKYPQIRLVIAGPVLDNSYFEKVLEAVSRNPFASWRGEVPNSGMPQLYRSAHVVLNTSLSEGGMANSILEGMAYARPVLVSDVEGNCSLVADGENGFLFSSEVDFVDKAEMLLLDKTLRKRAGDAGRSYVLSCCSAEREAMSYLELYTNTLETKKGV